ncbi:CU044_2847 family protein [Streptomyces sp. NPDC005573]|uniref:CU044_2847 family protein n=1 Tax=Streptomyces sp. NPDC005573 TaxID=3156890 RepID=UPI0033B7B185
MSTSPDLERDGDLELDDGTPVRFVLLPAAPQAPGPGLAAAPASDPLDDDLPEGLGTAVPVGSFTTAVANFAGEALRGALRPIGPLLQEVHDAATAVPAPPTELTVTFGVQVGHDLKFGIVGSAGQAHLTVTACWKTPAGAGPATGAG